MSTPALLHKARAAAEKAAAAERIRLEAEGKSAAEGVVKDHARHELLLRQLDNDCTRISALPQGEARIPLKRELLTVYLPLAEAYIESGEVFQNRLITLVMIWAFDVGDIENALKFAEVAITQGQPVPSERYKSSLPVVIADNFLKWAQLAVAQRNTPEPYLSTMLEKVLVWPVHDEIKLKYLRLAAALDFDRKDYAAALDKCEKAETISPLEAKVKTLKAKCEKALSLMPSEPTEEDQEH